jgi:hypothetical protein
MIGGACGTQKGKAHKDLMQKTEVRKPLGKSKCVPENITIYLKKLAKMVWTGYIWLGYRPVLRSSEERNKYSGYVTCRKFLDIRSKITH